MNKKTSLIIGIIILVVAVCVGYFGAKPGAPRTPNNQYGQNGQTQNSTTTKTGGNSGGMGTAPKGYTLTQVAQHSSQSSCWSAVNGGVYDLTNWINAHPGGPEAILSICGKDGSAAFNAQHGGQARPANELATFKIGILIRAL